MRPTSLVLPLALTSVCGCAELAWPAGRCSVRGPLQTTWRVDKLMQQLQQAPR